MCAGFQRSVEAGNGPQGGSSVGQSSLPVGLRRRGSWWQHLLQLISPSQLDSLTARMVSSISIHGHVTHNGNHGDTLEYNDHHDNIEQASSNDSDILQTSSNHGDESDEDSPIDDVDMNTMNEGTTSKSNHFY